MARSPADLIVFVGKRLLQLIPVVLGVILVTFVVGHLAVSNPCSVWVGPHAKPATVKACVAYFGLDQPVWVQFYSYLHSLVLGNWGNDPQGATPILPAVALALPATVELVLTALALMILIGIPLGVVAAYYNGRWPDHLIRVFYLAGWATPTYLGAFLLVLAAPYLGLPYTGAFSVQNPPIPQPTHMSVLDALLALSPTWFTDALSHLVLPALALALLNLGIATRMTRGSMLEVLPLDFIKTARMKGLGEAVVLFKHALRNSLITTTTVLGVTAGTLLSGTVIIEELFGWPGIGSYAYNAIVTYNFPGEIAVTVVFAIAVVLANLVADVLYGLLDPRVEWR